MKNSIFFVGLALSMLCGLSFAHAQSIKAQNKTKSLQTAKVKKKKKVKIIKTKRPGDFDIKKRKVVKKKVTIKKPSPKGQNLIIRKKSQTRILQPKKRPTLGQRARMVNSANSKGRKTTKTKTVIRTKNNLKATKKTTQVKIKNR